MDNAAMVKLWERLRSSPRLKGAFLFLVVAALVAGWALATMPRPDPGIAHIAKPVQLIGPLHGAERLAYDWQMRFLRYRHPRPLDNDVVLIGIDEETQQAFPEPIALWHRRVAGVYLALARAAPRAVAVDVVLPEKSFDSIQPGLDLALMRGIVGLRGATTLAFVQTINGRGEVVPFQPNLQHVVTPDMTGLDQQTIDDDLMSRRFQEQVFKDGTTAVTLAGRVLRRLGMPVHEGFIDYSVGAPLDYVPMHVIAGMDDATLRKEFAGRVVLIGSLVGTTDRWLLPVRLLAHDPYRRTDDASDGREPGVLIHAQVLRSHLAGAMLGTLPMPLAWLLTALAACAVFVSTRPPYILAAAVWIPGLLALVGVASVVSAHLLLPIASMAIAFWAALVVRAVFDAVVAVVERLRLQTSFAGQVSPAVMREMLEGNLAPGVSGQLAEVCVLFSDVRDFTTLSEKMPPVVVTTVLQRYFDRMVHAVHRFDGTVDKFIGDGMMVLFGAPRKSADPCGDAVECALAMMAELDQLNVEFGQEGLPQLVIGIGINYGTVTVGNIGSSERHNYSAIGDAVNVAARVEGLTKDLGRKIIITEEVVSRIEGRFNFDPLGTHNVKGHSPVKVWGIRTARVAPAAVEAEAVQ